VNHRIQLNHSGFGLPQALGHHSSFVRFTKGMIDSLNAEISLGTVANSQEAVRWLGYTYLFVRMRRNPFQYGLNLLIDLELYLTSL
jgi:replicative superfamily II helicase